MRENARLSTGAKQSDLSAMHPSGGSAHNRGAFGRLPNSAALDRSLDPASLCVLAFRLTYATQRSEFALNENHLVRQIGKGRLFKTKGAGRRVIRRSITKLAQLGYTQRRQTGRRHNGQWAYAHEAMTSKVETTPDLSRHIRREWFDGRWTVQEMALVLWLRACQYTSILGVCDRFNLHRETAAKLVRRMVDAGCVIEVKIRGRQLRMFKAAPLSAGNKKQSAAEHSQVGNWGNGVDGDVEKRDSGNVGNKTSGNVGNRTNTRKLRSVTHETYGVSHVSGGALARVPTKVGTSGAESSLELPAVGKGPTGGAGTLAEKNSPSRRSQLYRRADEELGPGSRGLITNALKMASSADDCCDPVGDVDEMLDFAIAATDPRAAFVALIREQSERSYAT